VRGNVVPPLYSLLCRREAKHRISDETIRHPSHPSWNSEIRIFAHGGQSPALGIKTYLHTRRPSTTNITPETGYLASEENVKRLRTCARKTQPVKRPPSKQRRVVSGRAGLGRVKSIKNNCRANHSGPRVDSIRVESIRNELSQIRLKLSLTRLKLGRRPLKFSQTQFDSN